MFAKEDKRMKKQKQSSGEELTVVPMNPQDELRNALLEAATNAIVSIKDEIDVYAMEKKKEATDIIIKIHSEFFGECSRYRLG